MSKDPITGGPARQSRGDGGRAEKLELKASDLSRPCEIEAKMAHSGEMSAEGGEFPIVGQARGVRAIEFGIDIDGDGYNVFVLGPKGSGRTTAVKALLEKAAARKHRPLDWCYVNNFQEPDKPVAVGLPAGKGRQFRDDMAEMMNELHRQLVQVFESESYQNRHDEIAEGLQELQNAEFLRLQEKAKEAGFALQRAGNLFGIVPMKEGKALSRDEFAELPAEDKDALEDKGKGIREELNDAMKKARLAAKEAREALRELDRKVATIAVEHALNEMRERYKESEKIVRYLNDVQEHVIENVRDFVGEHGEDNIPHLPGLPFPMPDHESALSKYVVVLLVDNADQKGAPVVFESNPTYTNLIGRVEHKAMFGALVTDFTMIKPGALHRAGGGYLVLQARDVLTNFMAWETLKRCLKNNEIQIEDMNEQFKLISTVSLRPEPIPLNVKVILIGQPMLYYLLYYYDEEFSKLFKVKVDFDEQMERTPEHVRTYAQFIARQCRNEGLLQFDADAIGRIVEWGSRLAGDQKKLTGVLGEVADMAHEAAYWASKEGNGKVTALDVDKAIGEKVYRSNRVEERLREMINDGTIMIDTDGSKVGQVNGIAVLMLGDYAFGKPTRITARAFAGRGGVINIDREARLSGRIHNKGMFILSGYLGGNYGRSKILNLTATICFEQLYEEIEGDSASSAELYALLSAIGRIPLNQSIAVTGSVNQHGEVQPVGGVTEKVEGFYDVCRLCGSKDALGGGLTGSQGVIIPRRNVRNLVLRPDVRKAVEEGRFHIYAVSNIEEGFAVLSGMEPGELGPNGKYPPNTFNQKIHAAFDEFLSVWQVSGRPEEPVRKEEPHSDQPPSPTSPKALERRSRQ